jgi:hypothetical protein
MLRICGISTHTTRYQLNRNAQPSHVYSTLSRLACLAATACTSREYPLDSRARIALTQCPDRLLNTVRQGDFYILTDDFDACESFRELRWKCSMSRSTTDNSSVDIRALEMVDEAYADRTEWIKKSIRTTAKVSSILLRK